MIREPLLAMALVAALPAQATTQDEVLSASILPGWQAEDGSHISGVEIVLAPGWKTYWRSPGDAGIPPRFDWSGSDNLANVQVHWPAPSVFHTNGMTTIGYHDLLVLPLTLTPVDPSRPVSLTATIELGVCRDICLPAFLSLSAVIEPPGAPDPAIKAALQARPARAVEAGLTTIACAVEPIADGLRLTATLTLPQPGSTETVAIETADPTVWVAEATARRAGGALIAQTELVPPEGAPFALDRSGVTVTVISDKGAVEITGCPEP